MATKRQMLDAAWTEWIPGAQVVPAHLISGDRDKGIQVRVTPPGGSSLTAHERMRDEGDYGDVLLEAVVNEDNPEPGWTAVADRTNLVLLAWKSSQRCLLLPGPALRRAFETRRDAWARRWQHRRSTKHGYKSLLIAVPTKELLDAVDEAFGTKPCSVCHATRTWSEHRGGVWPTGCASCTPGGLPPAWTGPTAPLPDSAPSPQVRG